MKFLKTFLFTISLTFLSFGIVTLKGFCASIALDGASLGVQGVVSGGMQGVSSFGIDPVSLSIFASETYDTLDNYLYSQYGYDIDDYYNRGVAQQQNFSASLDNTPLIANSIANKMTNNLYNASALTTMGYQLISKNIQQFGSNAKAWFFGKVDDATNTVSEALGNIVVKVTSEGLSNYSDAFNHLVNTNILDYRSEYGPMYSNTFKLYYPSNNMNTCELEFDSPVLTFMGAGTSATNVGLFFAIPLSDFGSGSNYLSNPKGFFVKNGTYYDITSISIGNSWIQDVNGVDYYVGNLTLYSSGVSSVITLKNPVGNIYPTYTNYQTFVSDFFSGNPITYSGVAYKYSDSTLSTIQSLIDSLVGKYVDSATLGQISDVISSIPVESTIDSVTGEYVPEAVVTPEQVAELEALIEQAIALSTDYASVLEVDEPVPDPSPFPNYQGTEVPEDFPSTIFSPINDSVGGMFDIVSIFEPLFYIFSFSAGLLGLWLVVPFVILFLILFRLLK